MDYQYKTPPWEHQRRIFEQSRDRRYFGLLMEQRTGKTKILIDTLTWNYAKGRVNAVLIVAPNGVHRNWIVNELPTHLPDYVAHRKALWTANQTRARKKELDDLFRPGPELRILSMNVEALSHKRAFDFALKFVRAFDTAVFVDESQYMKTPGVSRTKSIMKLKNASVMRRIATGTFGESPFDLYTQMNFLDEEILHATSFASFKARYAEMMDANSGLVRSIMQKNGARYAPQIVAKGKDGKPKYRNLDELQGLIEPHTVRVLKEDCFDIPPKVFQRRYFDMTPEQFKLYEDLRKHSYAEFNGREMDVEHRLTLITRLQEVAGGHFEKKPLMSWEENPRIRALHEEIELGTGKIIIWARFVHEIDQIYSTLATMYGPQAVGRVYGKTPEVERMRIIDEFQDRLRDDKGNPIERSVSGHASKLRFIVANPATTGISTGQDLSRAEKVIYYSNEFKLLPRLQSEDRPHGPNTKHSVLYVDMEAADCAVDRKIIDSLKSKKSVVDAINGDEFREWLA